MRQKMCNIFKITKTRKIDKLAKFTEKLENFKDALKDVLLEIDREKERIKNGDSSLWRVSALDNIVKPEMTELLECAQKGNIYFKYGKKQRMLESTYFTIETLDDLYTTILGEKIYKVSELFRKF